MSVTPEREVEGDWRVAAGRKACGEGQGREG
jgi:hypothetical protein